jgi:hypothetical protein
MKPTLTCFSSGASEPPAHAAARVLIGTIAMIPAAPKIAPVCFINSLRLFCSGAGVLAMTISCFGLSIFKSPIRKILGAKIKRRPTALIRSGTPLSFVAILRTVFGPLMATTQQQSCQQ